MSDRAGPERRGAYAFNSHRDALYKLLECVIRGKPSEDNHDNESCVVPRKAVDKVLSYPAPILWHEDMRPADLDAYHAANGRTKSSGDIGSLDNASIRPGRKGWDVNRPRVSSKGDAVAVDGRTSMVGAGAVPPETSSITPDRVVSPGTHTPGPAAEGGKDMLRESGMKTQPLTLSGASSRLRETCMDEGTTSNRSLHDIDAMQQAEAEESSRTAAARTDVDGQFCSKPCEDTSRFPFAMTPTTAPPELSQATQTMFLPGLPSQVLMTQERGDAEWEHVEADESQQEGTAASEQALSYLPAHHRVYVREDALKRASVESVESSASHRIRHLADRRGSDKESDGDDGEAGRATAEATTLGREEAHSRQIKDFIRALRELVELGQSSDAIIERGSAPIGARIGGSSSSSSSSGGGGNRPAPPFTFVPTEEVLPSCWSGGQAGIIAFLDSHLLHARERAPGGYAVRALELACHVLRQPVVCVKATDRSSGNAVHTAVAAVRRENEDHSEVVGVAGFVWELLRGGARDTG